MPVVTIQMWKGRTEAQKRELADMLTREMARICNTPPESIQIIFQDVAKQDWAVGGQLASDRFSDTSKS